jgi:hypothetical protein
MGNLTQLIIYENLVTFNDETSSLEYWDKNGESSDYIPSKEYSLSQPATYPNMETYKYTWEYDIDGKLVKYTTAGTWHLECPAYGFEEVYEYDANGLLTKIIHHEYGEENDCIITFEPFE